MSPKVLTRAELASAAAMRLRCPRFNKPHYSIVPVAGAGYRARFKCADCGIEFAISDAQMRRIVS